MGETKLLPKTLCALEFLTEAAKSGAVSYEDVSSACDMGNAQWANITFAPISRILKMVEADLSFPYQFVPDLTAIVTQKGKTSVGHGFFSNYPEAKAKSAIYRAELVSNARLRAPSWPHWAELSAFLKITPLPVLSPPSEDLVAFDNRSHTSQGKSATHQLMQDSILANPGSTGIQLSGTIIAEESQCEYLFWSLDRLDVVIKTTAEWIGFEVKPMSASEDELRKGIHQSVKYGALLRADLLDHGQSKPSRCALVVQGTLTLPLRALAQTLGIQVVERYSPASQPGRSSAS